MQTCPYCHHVLVSPLCCSFSHPYPSTLPQGPFVYSVSPAEGGGGGGGRPPHLQPLAMLRHQQEPSHPHHQPASNAPLINGFGEATDATTATTPTGASEGGGGGGGGGGENCEVGRVSSLPTPHVSGHMFHFPATSNDLLTRLSACQLSCHINCLTHGASFLCPPPPPSLPPSIPPPFPAYLGPGAADNALYETHRRHSSAWALSAPCPFDLSLFAPPGADDEAKLEASKQLLEQSGWYWARLSWQEAEVLLQPTSVGTFLMRDSADPNHRFSLSVQTEKGPTSVRIHFGGGKFRLKCEASVKRALPEFTSVIELIEFYVRTNEKCENHVWVDSSGKVYSPIRIHRPLLRAVPSLKHRCRTTINHRILRRTTAERLPPSLIRYIDEYPYWC